MLYTGLGRCTHRLDAYEVIKMGYTDRFINEDGFEEWTTKDATGNTVHCYANRYREIHTKIPVCPYCGKNMTEETQGYWTCIPCNVTRTEDESCNLELDEDYGEFQYDDGRGLLTGVPDWYYFYADHTPND